MPEPEPERIEPCEAGDIEAFLAGWSSGERSLRALYDHVLLEPVPQRMVALVRRSQLLASAETDPVKKSSKG